MEGDREDQRRAAKKRLEDWLGVALFNAEQGLGPQPVIADRFLVRAILGVGGFGVVVRAHDARLNTDVALKVFPGFVDAAAASMDEALREARALVKVKSDFVVRVIDAIDAVCGPAGDPRTCAIIVMELVVGQVLDEWAETPGRTAQEVLRCLLQCGEGLAHAHSCGVLHRDFKPSNVIVRGDGRPSIVDFGIALAAPMPAESAPSEIFRGSRDDLGPRLTEHGVYKGTRGYVAPEVLDGRPVAASDQYAFAIVCQEILQGRHPSVLKPKPRRPPEGGLELLRRLEPALVRATRPDREARFARMSDFVAELRARGGEGVSISSPSAQGPSALAVPARAERAPDRSDAEWGWSSSPSGELGGGRRARARGRGIVLSFVALACVAGGLVFAAARGGWRPIDVGWGTDPVASGRPTRDPKPARSVDERSAPSNDPHLEPALTLERDAGPVGDTPTGSPLAEQTPAARPDHSSPDHGAGETPLDCDAFSWISADWSAKSTTTWSEYASHVGESREYAMVIGALEGCEAPVEITKVGKRAVSPPRGRLRRLADGSMSFAFTVQFADEISPYKDSAEYYELRLILPREAPRDRVSGTFVRRRVNDDRPSHMGWFNAARGGAVLTPGARDCAARCLITCGPGSEAACQSRKCRPDTGVDAETDDICGHPSGDVLVPYFVEKGRKHLVDGGSLATVLVSNEGVGRACKTKAADVAGNWDVWRAEPPARFRLRLTADECNLNGSVERVDGGSETASGGRQRISGLIRPHGTWAIETESGTMPGDSHESRWILSGLVPALGVDTRTDSIATGSPLRGVKR